MDKEPAARVLDSPEIELLGMCLITNSPAR